MIIDLTTKIHLETKRFFEADVELTQENVNDIIEGCYVNVKGFTMVYDGNPDILRVGTNKRMVFKIID